jgi:hypothetical protein
MALDGNENVLLQMGGGKTVKGRVRKQMQRTERPIIKKVKTSEEHVFTNEELDYFYYVEGMGVDELKENPQKLKVFRTL